MPCDKRPATVLFGGRGRERRVSELSAAEIFAIAEDLRLDLMRVGISPEGEFYLYLGKNERIASGEWLSDVENLVRIMPTVGGFLIRGELVSPRVVFPLLHGDFGEDGKIQGLLDSLGIPYIGNDTSASAITQDKVYSKIIAKRVGVPILPYAVYSPLSGISCEPFFRTEREAIEYAEAHFGYPMFVKPASGGSSLGASVVYSRDGFHTAIEAAKRAYPLEKRFLIERALLEKRELECAYLALFGEVYSAPGEITVGSGFYDYEAKYINERASVSPEAKIDGEIRDKIREYSGRLVLSLSLCDMARIDFFIDDSGEIYFNEINSIPGMTKDSLYLKMLAKSGVSPERFVRGIASLGRDI